MFTARKILVLIAMVVTVGLLGLTNNSNEPFVAVAAPAAGNPTRVRASALVASASGRRTLAVFNKRQQCDDYTCTKSCIKDPEEGYRYGYCNKSDNKCYCEIYLYPGPDYA
ncbi:hypothetical protein F5H01DRAFT_382478 [Linnemannia elongata]|nr:hypothetical protein F5H01DRAFT_382478 [Linnemannia elongata]